MNNKAFSLIELSVILIVIGLLVAGIISGAKLIENTKIQSLIKEITQYKQASYAFKVQNNRLPGDLNNDDKIGFRSGEIYSDNSFGGNYVASNTKYGIPSDRVGFFVELYLNKLIGYEPKKYSPSKAKLDWNNGGSPASKINGDFTYQIQYKNTCVRIKDNYEYLSCGCNDIGCNKFILHSKSNSLKNSLDPEIARKFDLKVDDGKYNYGIVRGYCSKSRTAGVNVGKTSYEDAVKNKGKCNSLDINFDKFL